MKMLKTLAEGVVVVVLIITGGFLLFKFKDIFSGGEEPLEFTEQNTVAAKDIISWFKKPENANILKENSDFIALCIKGNETLKYVKDTNFGSQENKIDCVAAIFDSKKNEIVKGILFKCNQLNEDLLKLFGDKDMIVLQ